MARPGDSTNHATGWSIHSRSSPTCSRRCSGSTASSRNQLYLLTHDENNLRNAQTNGISLLLERSASASNWSATTRPRQRMPKSWKSRLPALVKTLQRTLSTRVAIPGATVARCRRNSEPDAGNGARSCSPGGPRQQNSMPRAVCLLSVSFTGLSLVRGAGSLRVSFTGCDASPADTSSGCQRPMKSWPGPFARWSARRVNRIC